MTSAPSPHATKAAAIPYTWSDILGIYTILSEEPFDMDSGLIFRGSCTANSSLPLMLSNPCREEKLRQTGLRAAAGIDGQVAFPPPC